MNLFTNDFNAWLSSKPLKGYLQTFVDKYPALPENPDAARSIIRSSSKSRRKASIDIQAYNWLRLEWQKENEQARVRP